MSHKHPRPSTQTELLALDRACVYYGDLRVLNEATLTVNEGEIVAIMGSNGAGKSTVLKTLFGALPVHSGMVLFHTKPIIARPHEMVERRVAFVPQGRRVFPSLSVEENLELGALNTTHTSEVQRRLQTVYTLFPLLETKRAHPSGTLSGGQQQMVAIGRGLMSDPTILLLDEPSLGLSPKMVKDVFAMIKLINQQHHVTVVIVEHNIKSLLSIADRVYFLDKGRVAASGRPTDRILKKICVGYQGLAEHA